MFSHATLIGPTRFSSMPGGQLILICGVSTGRVSELTSSASMAEIVTGVLAAAMGGGARDGRIEVRREGAIVAPESSVDETKLMAVLMGGISILDVAGAAPIRSGEGMRGVIAN